MNDDRWTLEERTAHGHAAGTIAFDCTAAIDAWFDRVSANIGLVNTVRTTPWIGMRLRNPAGGTVYHKVICTGMAERTPDEVLEAFRWSRTLIGEIAALSPHDVAVVLDADPEDWWLATEDLSLWVEWAAWHLPLPTLRRLRTPLHVAIEAQRVPRPDPVAV